MACTEERENKVNCLHLFTYGAQNTSLSGLSVDYTFALNNDMILNKVHSVNMTEQIGRRKKENPLNSYDYSSLKGT